MEEGVENAAGDEAAAAAAAATAKDEEEEAGGEEVEPMQLGSGSGSHSSRSLSHAVSSAVGQLFRRATPRTISDESAAAEATIAYETRAGLRDSRRRIQRYRVSSSPTGSSGRSAGGGFFGGLDFFLGKQRSFSAETAAPSVVHRISRHKLAALNESEPRLAALVQHVYLKTLCLDVQSIGHLL